MSISAELHAIGRPLADAQLAHPTVVGIAKGNLPEPVFRSWLEQDYLFLLDSAASYAGGLAALYPCMWGYSTLGRVLAGNPPAEPRYRAWIDTYAHPGFAELTGRIAVMIDEAAPDPDRARALFTEGMAHELAFWDVP
ncbi:thiaminase [Streptosporangium album]|uniref:Thiaminase n=1 Tax=Streptosporangium album TaxID=47479 RepID=A0A7W7RUE9_9ACTN|nr:hypothetical protein [Streptosporangium album]MBB4938380.1 thiaminase [Streptosporangium album]